MPGQAPIVATERGPRGGHLVFVAPDGTRTADLTRAPAGELVLDRSPAHSPDGRWIAFASTRGRDALAETSLWIVAAEPGAEPRRLTAGAAVDRDPAWAPDQASIVFASSRDGSFDLYELALTTGEDGAPRPRGEPERLTDDAASALSPSVSPDGETIVYMALDPESREMSLRALSRASSETRRLTEGPLDMTPAFSPRGDVIAFAAPSSDRGDMDLYLLDPDGSGRRKLADEPWADQTGPVFSADGRHVFATSVYRSVATAEPILSSVVVVDLDDPDRVVRALHDPVAVESRVGVTVSSAPISAGDLGANPPYGEALREAVFRELRREERDLEGEPSARPQP